MLRFKLVIIFALAAGSDAVPSLDDFLEALNTTQKIWTLKRNYTVAPNNVDQECVFAEKVLLTSSDYEYNENFTVGLKRFQTHMYANLGEDAQGPYMKAGKEKGVAELVYTLREWYFHDRCAVRTFQNMSVPSQAFTGCELLVWDYHIDGHMDHCLHIYNKVCTGISHTVYWMWQCKLSQVSKAETTTSNHKEKEPGC